MNFKMMTTDELAKEFEKICLFQDKCIDLGKTSEYNRSIDRMLSLFQELRGRTTDQRAALSTFYAHRNPQVRLQAAMETLAIFPDRARKVLQTISDRNEYPQAADARGIMRALDEGRFVPD